MFEKKQYIYSETLGVCRVEDIVKLNAKKDGSEGLMYYVLRSKAQPDKNCYIPVEGHKVLLRELISKEDAASKLNEKFAGRRDELEIGEVAYVLGRTLEEIKEEIKEDVKEEIK